MAGPVRAKKHLGQHFLRDENVALRIVDALQDTEFEHLVEVGPGDGVLSKYLFERYPDVVLFDVDQESIVHLKQTYPLKADQIMEQDFLRAELQDGQAVIGNFPYNISSQIVFKILEDRAKVAVMVGMFQKEVAERIAAPPGSRTYGILSVLTQAYYEVSYLFTVPPQAFEPPPKVDSGVLMMVRKPQIALDCDEGEFFSLVKRAFNQRRKMIRKSLRDLMPDDPSPELEPFLTKRPEQLSFNDFIQLTQLLAEVK
jgi:16S rRNA (adenine1518-N6/adenine1519-N6)-dimethyltransferase